MAAVSEAATGRIAALNCPTRAYCWLLASAINWATLESEPTASTRIIESLACGTPVVATRVGAAPQLLANPELGIMVDPSPEAICAGLSQALQQEWNTQAISAYAQGQTWENVAASVDVVLKGATGVGPGA